MGFINFKYLYIYLSIVIGGGGGGGGGQRHISYSLLCNGICSIKILPRMYEINYTDHQSQDKK